MLTKLINYHNYYTGLVTEVKFNMEKLEGLNKVLEDKYNTINFLIDKNMQGDYSENLLNVDELNELKSASKISIQYQDDANNLTEVINNNVSFLLKNQKKMRLALLVLNCAEKLGLVRIG